MPSSRSGWSGCRRSAPHFWSHACRNGLSSDLSGGKFVHRPRRSKNAIEIAAFVDGRIAGTAGIDPIDDKEKIRHRADFGIAIEKAYWGRGIGKALTLACIECAKQAGYLQIELEVVAENASAVRLYKSVGFQEYGRNPRGFRARSGWQTLVLMRLELDS